MCYQGNALENTSNVCVCVYCHTPFSQQLALDKFDNFENYIELKGQNTDK